MCERGVLFLGHEISFFKEWKRKAWERNAFDGNKISICFALFPPWLRTLISFSKCFRRKCEVAPIKIVSSQVAYATFRSKMEVTDAA